MLIVFFFLHRRLAARLSFGPACGRFLESADDMAYNSKQKMP